MDDHSIPRPQDIKGGSGNIVARTSLQFSFLMQLQPHLSVRIFGQHAMYPDYNEKDVPGYSY